MVSLCVEAGNVCTRDRRQVSRVTVFVATPVVDCSNGRACPAAAQARHSSAVLQGHHLGYNMHRSLTSSTASFRLCALCFLLCQSLCISLSAQASFSVHMQCILRPLPVARSRLAPTVIKDRCASQPGQVGAEGVHRGAESSSRWFIETPKPSLAQYADPHRRLSTST